MAKEGWTLAEPFIEDAGRSAWKSDHLSVGNLGKLRKRIDAGHYVAGTRIIVENLDRLSRQEYRTARRWIEDVNDAGLIIEVARPRLTLNEDAMSGINVGPMLQHLFESKRANSEGNTRSDRQQAVVANLNQRARDGVVATPCAPLWLNGEKGATGFQRIEDRVAVVNMIYEWCASGLGYTGITKRLNATVEPWSVGWKSERAQWCTAYVRDILHSPAVEGEYHVGKGSNQPGTGEIIRGYYPRIVEADLVERARAAIAKRQGTGGRNAGEAKNLFVGVTTCEQCGGSVGRLASGTRGKSGSIGRGTSYEYFNCRNARYGTCANKMNYRYDLIERAALTEMLHLALDDTHFVVVDDVAPLSARTARARKRIEELEHEQGNVIAVLRKMPDSAAMLAELTKVEGELSRARAELDTAQRALDQARGQVSPDEHLRRVQEVRDAIHDNDPDVREQARRKVRDAIKGIVALMTFDQKGDGRVTMILKGNHVAFEFDRSGNVLKRHNYLAWVNAADEFKREASARMVGARGQTADVVALDDILRRARA